MKTKNETTKSLKYERDVLVASINKAITSVEVVNAMVDDLNSDFNARIMAARLAGQKEALIKVLDIVRFGL